MKNILENNKLIAEFMGKKFMVLPDTDEQCFELENSWDIIHSDDFIVDNAIFSYHSNWNKLIEVLEKIKKLGYFIEWQFLSERAYIMTSHETRNIIAKVSSIPNKSASKPPTAENPAYVSEFNNPKEVLYNLVLRFIKYYNNQN